MWMYGSADAGSVSAGTWPEIPLNFTAAPQNDPGRSFGADKGCLDVDAAAGPISPRRWSELACVAATPSARHELKIERGEASGRLDFLGADQGDVREVRGVFNLEHSLNLGALGGWQLHSDASVGHPTAMLSGFPVDEQTHVAVSRGLPWGINLRLGASVAAQGAFDPRFAPDQNAELAAEFTRSFVLSPTGTAHMFSLKLAQQSSSDRPSGTAQRTTLADFTYAHALYAGKVSADVAYLRAAPIAGPSQNSTRALIRFSHPF